MNLNEYRKNAATHIMIFGEPLTGKSHLAATTALCTQDFNVVWIATDRSIAHLEQLPAAARDRINFISLPDTRDNPVAFPSLKKILTGNPVSICHRHGVVSCAWCIKNTPADVSQLELGICGPETVVVIDHLSQVVDSAMNIAITYSWSKGETDANQRKTWDNLEEALEYYKPSYGQWQYLWNFMSGLLTTIQAAPYNVVAISHIVETKQEDGNKRLVPHGGSDRFSRNVTRFFDHVISCEVMNGKHRYSSLTTASTTLITGSRTGIDISATITEGGRPTLQPFFDSDVKPPKEYGFGMAEKLLTKGPVGGMLPITDNDLLRQKADMILKGTKL